MEDEKNYRIDSQFYPQEIHINRSAQVKVIFYTRRGRQIEIDDLIDLMEKILEIEIGK